MHEELVAVTVPLKHSDDHVELLLDMLIAPSYVVRAFAEFLADREDEDTFTMKQHPVKFQDCSVTVGDSKKVVSAYECMKRYNIPTSTHNFFAELIKRSASSTWKLDPNFRLFEKWYANRKVETDDQ